MSPLGSAPIVARLDATGRPFRVIPPTPALVDDTAALAIAVPLGIASGRVAWRWYAESLHVVPEVAAPAVAVALVVAGAGALAFVFGLVMGRRPSRGPIASTLRSE